jgi:hypothetical protein
MAAVAAEKPKNRHRRRLKNDKNEGSDEGLYFS